MTRTYVIPDIHGRLDLLNAALDVLSTREPGTVIFLGDYIDRGPESRGVLERLIDGPPERWTWVCLQGNHETMMLVALLDKDQSDPWLKNGGDTTLANYSAEAAGLWADHAEWCLRLPLWHEDTHRVYVHASVEENVPLSEQTDRTLQWARYPKGADVGYHGKHVVHGHTPVKEPELLTNRSNLDTGAVFTGRLTIGEFDDDTPGGPIAILSVGDMAPVS